MLSFTEFILEQAKAKSEIKDKYETISLIVFDHLLKSLVYEDKDNTEKHLREMSGTLRSIQSVKSRSSYIDKETLKQILFDDYKDIDFKKYIKDKDIDYGNLQKRNLSKKEIFNILEKVYLRLSSELSKQSFKTLLEYPEFKQFLNQKERAKQKCYHSRAFYQVNLEEEIIDVVYSIDYSLFKNNYVDTGMYELEDYNETFTPGAAISDLNVNELTDMFIEYLEKNHKHITIS